MFVTGLFSCLHTAKVGKTSLIMSLVSEEFPDEVCVASQSDGQHIANNVNTLAGHPRIIIAAQIYLTTRSHVFFSATLKLSSNALDLNTATVGTVAI